MAANKGLDADEVYKKFLEFDRNVSKTARFFKVDRHGIRKHLRKRPGYDKPGVGGKVQGTLTKRVVGSGIRRFILTSAQNNTKVPEPLWDNLQALRSHYDAQLMVGTFTYNKNAYGPMAVKRGSQGAKEQQLWYDERLYDYMRDERVEIAPGLMWCGEMNILPTAVRPLAELHTYTGPASGVFPHSKIAMQSVATGKFEATKFNYTTGACTMVNYIKKLAGLRAEFHHTYGALLVEVDEDGTWFARQLNADRKWRIHDLNIVADGGVVKQTDGIEAIVWGDIHRRYLDPVVAELAWGKGGVLDELKPRFQFFHDILDFRSRNHHERDNIHKLFQRYAEGTDSIVKELEEIVGFLHVAGREWCQSVVVNSNHDRAMERWLREAEWRRDVVNAEFYLQAQAAWLEAIRRKEEFLLLEWALHGAGAPDDVLFLDRDQSFRICKGSIECAMHGDEGPRGARGNSGNLGRIGAKVNMADKHACEIRESVYTAGTSSLLDLEYNHGPSDWSHTHILNYPNGKRALLTMADGRWRVPPPKGELSKAS